MFRWAISLLILVLAGAPAHTVAQASDDEFLGTDMARWEEAIRDGRFRNALLRTFGLVTQRPDTLSFIASAMKEARLDKTDEGELRIIQKYFVPDAPGASALVDTEDRTTLDAASTVGNTAHHLVFSPVIVFLDHHLPGYPYPDIYLALADASTRLGRETSAAAYLRWYQKSLAETSKLPDARLNKEIQRLETVAETKLHKILRALELASTTMTSTEKEKAIINLRSARAYTGELDAVDDAVKSGNRRMIVTTWLSYAEGRAVTADFQALREALDAVATAAGQRNETFWAYSDDYWSVASKAAVLRGDKAAAEIALREIRDPAIAKKTSEEIKMFCDFSDTKFLWRIFGRPDPIALTEIGLGRHLEFASRPSQQSLDSAQLNILSSYATTLHLRSHYLKNLVSRATATNLTCKTD